MSDCDVTQMGELMAREAQYDNVMDKFLKKNLENINKLNTYIDINNDNIHHIIVSPEIYEYIKKLDNCVVIHNELIHYKDKLVVCYVYLPAKSINFVLKSEYIAFNLPCICGIYPDEEHP